MIAKITRGEDIKGLVRYLFGPGERGGEHPEVHADQRAVAASEGLDVELGVQLDADAQRDLAWQLDIPRAIHSTEVAGGHVWHLSLSNRADDRVLTDAEWGQVATETMDRLGFTATSGKAPCPWVAVRHGLSAAGNDHLHVAVSLVREDGTKASIWRDRVTVSKVCGDMERRYGLNVVEGRGGAGLPGLSRGELERAERLSKAAGKTVDPDRLVLARGIREASVSAGSEAEFVSRLRSSGVLVRPWYEKGGKSQDPAGDRVSGYSVALRPTSADVKPTWIGGGRLARDLALPALRARWEPSPEASAAAGQEWSAARTVPHKLYRAPTSAMREAKARMAVDRLAAVPAGDVTAWRSAARDAAGACSAMARRVELDAPGPWSRAADVLARSAQGPRDAPAPARGGRDMTAAVTVLTQAMVSKDGVGQWVRLAVEVVRMVEAIQRAHELRGELLQAQRLAAVAQGELSSVRQAFRTLGAERLVPDLLARRGLGDRITGVDPTRDAGLNGDRDLDR